MVIFKRSFEYLIIDKSIDVRIDGYNIRFYKERFPNIKKGDIIKVNQVKDLSPRSTLDVECTCSNSNCEVKFLRKRRNIHSSNTYCSDRCRGEGIKSNNHEFRKKEILSKFKERIDNGKSIKYNDIRVDDPSLLFAIDRYFSIWELCQELGISEDIMVSKYGLTRNVNKRTLSRKEIENRLLYLKSIGRLTTSAMRTEFGDYRLECSIKKIYGSVEKCLDELGIERDILDQDILITMGRKFEYTFKDILNSLRIEFEYQKILPNGCIPDFHLSSSNTIIDTKLSTWTTSIPSDIVKYSNYCDKLIFVYLRKGSTLPRNQNKVEFKSVYSYIDRLPAEKQGFYLSKIEEILSYHP